MDHTGYVKLYETGELEKKANRLAEVLENCSLCPRMCGVDRRAGEQGLCGICDQAVVASFSPHHGEEPPLSGLFGSGTIFFSGCTLSCIFCQNWDISHGRRGRPVSSRKLADMMISLQKQGCHNINLVTPTHVIPMWMDALVLAAKDGLEIPLVYNSGGYERLEILRELQGVVDIYLPDAKYWDSEASSMYSFARDYPERMRDNIKEMWRQVGSLKTKNIGRGMEVAVRGLIVRHLVLPGGLSGTGNMVDFLAGISEDVAVNIMDQYRPCYKAIGHEVLGRRCTIEEYEVAMEKARKAGLHIIT